MKCRKILAALLALTVALAAAAFAAEPFTDVAADAYYAEAVDWAAEQTITEGRGNGVFDPDAAVTRAEAVTFLWRMAGRPAPAGTESFADVERDPENGWYLAAVQWAVENGITDGTGEGNFSPALTCTRGMILTMLYRMEGCPFDAAMTAEEPADNEAMTIEEISNMIVRSMVEAIRDGGVLTDVQEGDYFELPVIWAMMQSILSEAQVDMEAGTVGPNLPCPRGEMVYFLYGAAQYETARDEAEAANRPLDPIETGTVPETVVLDERGVNITVTGIEQGVDGEAWLALTVVNGSDRELRVDTSSLFVNTFVTSPSTFIPVTEGPVTFYEDVDVAAGETKDFNVGLNGLREKGIAAVYELELRMGTYVRSEDADGYMIEEFAVGAPVEIRTSLYSADVSYDPEGVAVYEQDGLKVLVCRAENHEYMGPQLAVFASNSSGADVSLELVELKLDGESAEAFFSMWVPAGKRNAETVYIDFDYETIPVVREAELTLSVLDQETWETAATFAPVTVPFAD